MAGIYIHIPYCAQACHYCDFHFSTNLKNRKELLEALTKELQLQQDYLKEPVETIYLGGGTPSLLDPTELYTLIEKIGDWFLVEESAEISIETNPDDIQPKVLRDYAEMGINRLSLGIQTFSDDYLKLLNRVHNREQARSSLSAIKESPFTNYTVDLMFAFPGSSVEHLDEDLKVLLEYDPPHISCYNLTIEPGTVFGHWAKKGRLAELQDHQAADQYECLMDTLLAAGYDHYEISNFAKPGFQSRHNSNYWQQHPYLGLGPGAHSFNGTSRQYNVRNNTKYIQTIGNGLVPFEKEVLSKTDRINERIMVELRTSNGLDLTRLENELAFDLLAENRAIIDRYQQQGYLTKKNNRLNLTKAGRLLADKITEELFIV